MIENILENMGTTSTFFFPLRTNVEFFKSGESYLDLESKIKQSLLLYENIVFEEGVYKCFVGPKGRLEQIGPFDSEHDNIGFENQDTAKSFFVRARSSSAKPDAPFTHLVDSPLERSFRAQFHTITQELLLSGIDGVTLEGFELNQPSKSFVRNLVREDKTYVSTPGEMSKYE